MKAEQQIAMIDEVIKKYDVCNGITKEEFYSQFEEQSLIDIKDEMWEQYCFMLDIINIININKTAKTQMASVYGKAALEAGKEDNEKQ